MPLALLAIPLAYAIGALPLGLWALSSKGPPRTLSVYNLGLAGAIRKAGLFSLLLSGLLDLFKALLALSLAAALGVPPGSALAGLVAVLVYLGHLYPPLPVWDRQVRGRGGWLLLGLLVAQAVTGWAAPLWLWPAAVFCLALGIFGYLSLGIVLAALSQPLAFTALAGAAAAWPSWLLAALVVWRFKEQLGRILDGLEPRVWAEPQESGEITAAFLIHPMNFADLWQTRRIRWLRPLVASGLLKPSALDRMTRWLRPMKLGELRGVETPAGQRVRVLLISSPLLPHVFRAQPELILRRAVQAARLAEELGARVLGLGALWSTLANKGQEVQSQAPGICITNGGAYTAGTIRKVVSELLGRYQAEQRSLAAETAAVVGASGVVAFGIAWTLAPQVGKLLLAARDKERLGRLAEALRKASPATSIEVIDDLSRLKEAGLIFTATSDPDPVIFAEHLSPNTWIFDEGRPLDVDASAYRVPGVRVVPGGVVRPPGHPTSTVDLGFGEGLVPACLAETIVLALTEAWSRSSLGSQTLLENIEFFVEEGDRLGFEVLS